MTPTATLIATSLALAISQGAGPTPLTAAERAAVIERVADALDRNYVFPEVAERMAAALRAQRFDGFDGSALADALTEQLREISRDKHLRVRFSVETLPERETRGAPSPDDLEAARREHAWQNFGFERVLRLPGNVGYLELFEFVPPELSADTAHAAMAFLANTDALIIDLRNNGGGSPAAVQLLASYLFGPEPVHLNDLYSRPDDRTEEFWTMRDLPGKRYVDKDVFVLTSGDTFSAAEEFAYDLKCLQRATIVGTSTGGGAHPCTPVRIDEHFVVVVPTGRAVNPITKTNWEGAGVEPHVACERERALERAHALALERLIPRTAAPDRRARLQELLGELQRGRR